MYWRNRCPSIKHRSRWTLGVWTVTKYFKRLHKPFFFLYTVNRFIYLFIYFKWTAVALYDQWRVEFRSKIKLLAVILYIQILYYILLYYIELRESQTATFTFSSVLQFTPDCTALSLTVERWLAVTNSRERARLCKAKVWCDKSKLVAGFLSRKIRRYTSLRSLCMGSCRPVAFGVNAPCDSSSAATCLLRSEPDQSSVCVTSRRICHDRNR